MTSGDTTNSRAYLPVPEFLDHNLRHCQKRPPNQNDPNRTKKPPKLNPKHDSSFCRSPNSSSAHLVSFKDSSAYNDILLSSHYSRDFTETYYDQCFETISKIGEGSFGEVFKVRSKEDGLLYAVKKSKQFFRSENYRQERLEEVRRYEQFSGHDHCVTLYKAWEQDDRLFMQMELCKGSLESYLAEKRNLPESTVWSILLDLLLALKCLHDRNLIHLDIKLENILITDDGTCKLADFGLVVDIESARRIHPTEGDNRYIAPEIMKGHFSKAADVFSLGITILELSCNLELPPNGPLWQELRSNVLPEEFIKVLSPELQNVIRYMMASEPARRPTVDDLLITPKLLALQQSRKRWKYLKYFKNFLRSTRRYIWTKLCNLKNFTYSLIDPVIRGFQLTDKQHSLNNSSSDCTTDRSFEMSDLDHTPNLSDYEHSSSFVNSTPLNHYEVRKYRKDATKSNIRSELVSHETSALICKKLFTKTDDYE